jgi:hypothetical protein
MTPDFQTLPESGIPRYRRVGPFLMDAEQYTTEGWHRDSRGYWIATLDGLRRYGQLVAKRRNERIAAAVNRG